MPKRGQKRPHKMRVEWPGAAPFVQAFSSVDERAFAAERQAKRVGPDGETRCQVTLFGAEEPTVVVPIPPLEGEWELWVCTVIGHGYHDTDRPCPGGVVARS